MKPNHEHCNKALPVYSEAAMICIFECTFCKNCVDNPLQVVCPNCGGGFQKRPIQSEGLSKKDPLSAKIPHKPVNVNQHLKQITN